MRLNSASHQHSDSASNQKCDIPFSALNKCDIPFSALKKCDTPFSALKKRDILFSALKKCDIPFLSGIFEIGALV